MLWLVTSFLGTYGPHGVGACHTEGAVHVVLAYLPIQDDGPGPLFFVKTGNLSLVLYSPTGFGKS